MIKTIVSTALPVDEKFLIRKNVITSGTSSKRVCIVTGTHGDELEGQYVCYTLAKLLSENLDSLNGTVEIYPALNPLGIDTITRGMPGFDLDMNRIFPGDAEGTMAENVAYSIIEDLRGADMVIDVHSSNIFLREVPQVRVNVETQSDLMPFAKLLNMDFIWVHESATVLASTLAHSLNTSGTRCMVVEMGVGMRISHRLGNQLVSGILNLLRFYNMWKGSIFTSALKTPLISANESVIFLNAAKSGVFLTEVKNGIVVDEGEEIGCIVSSLTGEVLQKIVAPVHGYLFTIRAYPIVYEGSLVARIHVL